MVDTKEELVDIQKQVNDNTLRLERITSKDWYSNQDLYEKMKGMKARINEFNKNFHKYNGLIEERKEDRRLLENLHERVGEIEIEEKVKEEELVRWREWIAWLIAVISVLYQIFG